MIKEKTKITTVGGSKYILIPSELFGDSTFPFSQDDELDIEIIKEPIIIETLNGATTITPPFIILKKRDEDENTKN